MTNYKGIARLKTAAIKGNFTNFICGDVFKDRPVHAPSDVMLEWGSES